MTVRHRIHTRAVPAYKRTEYVLAFIAEFTVGAILAGIDILERDCLYQAQASQEKGQVELGFPYVHRFRVVGVKLNVAQDLRPNQVEF